MMNTINIIFESPKKWHAWLIELYLARRVKVWVIEPFHAYHYNNGIRFFPNHLPQYIKEMLSKEKVGLITAEELGSRDIYPMAADRAVEVTSTILSAYSKKHRRVISSMCSILKSPLAEHIFYKQLCHKLGTFYSQNILLNRIERKFKESSVKIYPDINIFFYHYFLKLLKNINQNFFEHENVKFARFSYLLDFAENSKNNLLALAGLGIQTLGGLIFKKLKLKFRTSQANKKFYKYGIAIVSPERQLVGNKRGPDFLVDNKKISDSDCIYFCLLRLGPSAKNNLKRLNSRYYNLPDRKWQNFSHFFSWSKLFLASITQELFTADSIVYETHLALSEYTRWLKALNNIEIEHFITHADFGFLHIPRNIALKQHKVQTWFFIDSMNYSFNFQKDENFLLRHPFWAYLFYDHFIAWDEALAQYFILHPGLIEKKYIVGCLWADQINRRQQKNFNAINKFVISVFDTTYTCNSTTSYKEGIAFAQDILKLAQEFADDLQIVFKEKKNRNMHTCFDAEQGVRLLGLYEIMDKEENIKFCSSDADTADIISSSDITISFPFTSTTFEALSAQKPAIWHDPLGLYRDTPYAKLQGVTTHSYEELKRKVIEIKNSRVPYKNSIPNDSALMDPYRDGKAIEKFRDLLVNGGG